MFFDKLLNKIPFFRNRRIKKIKEDLVEIKHDFTEGHFNEQYISGLHNILNSPLIDFSDDLVSSSLNDITTYTKSSMGASKLAEKPIISKATLGLSPLLSLNRSTGYFSEWYSNEDSLLEFINVMKLYLQAHTWQIASPDYQNQEKVSELINSMNPEFLDSLLYRLLLEDLVSIITFYVESKYD